MMVQIPDTFDPTNACIVTAPSSGSRGVYGAIATAGEWGLKHGCAVAYTDKGTGTGAHDLQTNTVNLIRGERAAAAAAGDGFELHRGRSAPRERAAFNAATPNRFAFKHAHSQQNPEKDWGTQRAALDQVRLRRARTRSSSTAAACKIQQAQHASSSRRASRTAAALRCARSSRTTRG